MQGDQLVLGGTIQGQIVLLHLLDPLEHIGDVVAEGLVLIGNTHLLVGFKGNFLRDLSCNHVA